MFLAHPELHECNMHMLVGVEKVVTGVCADMFYDEDWLKYQGVDAKEYYRVETDWGEYIQGLCLAVRKKYSSRYRKLLLSTDLPKTKLR